MLVESAGNEQRVYDSLLLDARHLGIFSNELAVKIIGEIAKQPTCAMDIARRLKQNEQKIYYHLRKMRSAGIVRLNGVEHRYGMTAKMFELVSPVIAAKLYEAGYEVKSLNPAVDSSVSEFFSPFIKDGKLDSKIIVGDPYPHGEYDAPANEGSFLIDLLLLFGGLIKDLKFPAYSLDTEVKNSDLKNNLILIGNTRTNIIINKMNGNIAIKFDESGNLISKDSIYSDPRTGIILKCANPFSKNKKILMIGGVRTRGLRTSVIALTQCFDTIADKRADGDFVRIVEGYDKDGDGIIDSIKVLE